MSRAELGDKIRELAVVMLLALFAMPIYIGYWALVKGPELTAHPANQRAEARAAKVKPGRIVTADGVEVLGRQRDEPTGAWERTYPSPTTFCHLTGYNAKTGLQAALRPELVQAALRRNPFSALTQPEHVGNDVQLTIDADAQRVARRALARKKGAVVALDSRTGEILALASGPTYDPDEIVSSSVTFDLFNTNPDSPGLNRALRGMYPPGSIFKLIVAAAAIEAGRVSIDREYTCHGSIEIDDRQMGCWKTSGHGSLDLPRAVANSCNVYFAQLGIDLGTEAISEYAAETGIFSAPSLPLVTQASRLATERKTDLASAHYANGQGDLLVTPLAAARMAAAIANGGALREPWIVKAVMDPEGRVVDHGEAGRAHQALRPSTATALAGMMELAVESGTADAAAMADILVAGKTGSAENPRGAAHAWFVGFAPAEAPRVAISVVIENGGSGGAVAAPIARDVMSELLK